MTLIARENELKSVCALLAPSGIGGTLVLRGEAGVGKSALLNEVISAGKRAGLRILSTAGVSSQMQRPFAGLSHLMRSVLSDLAPPDGYGDAWDTVGAAVGGQDVPIGNLFSVAYAVLEVLSACSAKQDLLLIVDDASWIDEQSWCVLSFVGRRIDFDKIALVMAMRDGVEADRRLRDSFLPTLRIEPLPDEAAAALLDGVAPALQPRIRSWILLEAGGNPLGLLELSDEAKRRGSAAISGTLVPLPDRLEQTYAGLLSELPEAAQLLVTRAYSRLSRARWWNQRERAWWRRRQASQRAACSRGWRRGRAAASRRFISGTVSGIMPGSGGGAWPGVTGGGAWVSVRSFSRRR